jgi:hypothetical protein
VHRKGEALGRYPRGVQRLEDGIHELHAGIPKDFDAVQMFGPGMLDPPLHQISCRLSSDNLFDAAVALTCGSSEVDGTDSVRFPRIPRGAMTYRTILALFKRTYSDWDDDNAPRSGAALAFYTIVSISPLAILVLAIVSLIFNRSSAQAHLLSQARSLAGLEGASTIQSLLEDGKSFDPLSI